MTSRSGGGKFLTVCDKGEGKGFRIFVTHPATENQPKLVFFLNKSKISIENFTVIRHIA